MANKLIDLVPAPYQAKAKSWLASQAAGSNEPDFQHSGYSMLSVRSEVRDLKKFNFPYMLTMNNATTATSLVQLEKQLSDRKVLVPEHFFTDFCRPWKADYRIMSTLFLFPTKLFPQKNNPDIIKTSFCTMLNNMSPIEAKPEALPQGYKLFATP